MRRRCFMGFVLALLVCSASAGGALAQRGGGGRGGMMGGMGRSGLGMLRIAEVQKELKMTPEQVAKIDAKQDEVRQKMQSLFQGGGNPADMTPAERQKRMEQMQEVQTEAVNEILDPTQQKRYRQLDLQQQGPNALARKDVADELKLTDEQKKAIADAQQKADDDRRAAMQGVDFQGMSQEDRAKLMTKMQDIQKATGDRMLAVLTDAQKAQWKEMQGAPFTFPAPRPGGPGGGGARPAAAAR